MLELAELETPTCDCGQPCEPDETACWQCLTDTTDERQESSR